MIESIDIKDKKHDENSSNKIKTEIIPIFEEYKTKVEEVERLMQDEEYSKAIEIF